MGAEVVGVSKDSVKSHRGFSDKLNLPFVLLSDEGLDMLRDFGVWKEKKLYGKTHMGTERTTFLVDEEGMILTIWPKVKVEGHVEEVLDVLKG